MLAKEVKQIEPAELLALAQRAKGKIKNVFLHWTAGAYGHVYDDYHLCIGKTGNIETDVKMNDLAVKRQHTWLRNTGSIGIAIEAARGASVSREGIIRYGLKAQPTKEQVEGMALAVAVICKGLELPIDANTVMTHAEVAAMDGYGIFDDDPDMRWDLLRLPFSGGMTGGEYIRRLAASIRS